MLMELDLINKREERNKLLRFNEGLSAVEALQRESPVAIELSNQPSKGKDDSPSASATSNIINKKEEP